MKHPLLLACLVVMFAFASHAAPVSIYGPQKFSASPKTKEYQVSIPGPGADKDGVITITNGDGQDLTPAVCSGTLVQRILCGVENLTRILRAGTQRPSAPEIFWNNQLIATKVNLPQTKGRLQIAIKVQAQNTLKVRLQGLPTAYINIEIKSESASVNQLPIARIHANPANGIAPELISFSGLASSDPDSDLLTNYSWDFGDGSFATGSLVTHSYLIAGTFTARLTVIDSKGGQGTISQTIVINPNQLPTANFIATAETGLGLLRLHLDASSSSDSDGQIVSYVSIPSIILAKTLSVILKNWPFISPRFGGLAAGL